MKTKEIISFSDYTNKVREEVLSISDWPNSAVNEDKSLYCPFDLTPGFIREFYLDGNYPIWSKTFEEKGIEPDGSNAVSIALDLIKYKHLVMSTNSREVDEDILLGDFADANECDTLSLERELIILGNEYPLVLIERIVVKVDDGEHIWAMSIIRGLHEEELITISSFSRTKGVMKIFGVETYSQDEYGPDQNWSSEIAFEKEVAQPLMYLPEPFAANPQGCFSKLTSRSLR